MSTRIEQYQKRVLDKALPLSEKVVEAFYRYPRHLCVPEYTMAEAYSDHPLLLWNKPPYISTISQPSFVLKILDLLQIHHGHRVFELGSGSGWNTALMAYLVGESGKVISVEVIPELAIRAQKYLEKNRIFNALVKLGDGFEGDTSEAPFDRIIFTAGANEFPEKLFDQLKIGGLMIFVRENDLGYDFLELIEKQGNGMPLVLRTIPCSFVSVIRKSAGDADTPPA
ncbi:MAG: L-isoaspartyl protein carboxyl methyltransferase [Bdellovibrio sp. ArHS]|uniref:protein-L-isoaspartate O-methyltransferase family protein n=1 Tax=Bdellovibrio sp. ArHS TaxID=1569284 RepID=UPI00058343B6|nr:protein-L-isoaspartate O-methyltransferase [Bdellovibrio sp. ArHS]KHD88395.1 MAG: L-isoaspartyl protein carboxyl methyltransferase [Bdellovibrio sp. ArHS]